MEHKNFEAYTKAIDDRTVTGIAALFGNVDVVGDRIFKGAFKKTIQENLARVRHLWMHDEWSPPTAAIKSLNEVGRGGLPDDLKAKHPEVTGGLEVEREYLQTPRGDEILAGIKAGALNQMSFGYTPVKFDFEELEDGDSKGFLVRNLREIRLWDISDVNWGANELTIASKAAVPYKDTGTADEDTEWSAPTLSDFTDESWGDLSDAERRRIAGHYAWVAAMPPEKFGDGKLPHHKAGKSGIGKAVWRGCSAAMGALMGARGGVDIPSADMDGVYNHLVKHYKQFDKEPPEKSLTQLAHTASIINLDEIKYLSKQELGRLKNALDELHAILAAEPPDDESLRALTERLKFQLSIYERDPILLSVR